MKQWLLMAMCIGFFLSACTSNSPISNRMDIPELGISFTYPTHVSHVYQGNGIITLNAPAEPAFDGDNITRGPLFFELHYEPQFDPQERSALDTQDYNGIYYGKMADTLIHEQQVLLNGKDLLTNSCLTPPSAADRVALQCRRTKVGGKPALTFFYNHSVNDPGRLGIGYIFYKDGYRIHISLSPVTTRLDDFDTRTNSFTKPIDEQLQWGNQIVESIIFK